MAVVDLQRQTNVIMGTEYISWLDMTTDDTGQPLEASGHSDKTVMIIGDFGGTASVSMYGSNVETPSTNDDDWFLLTDTTETNITATAKFGAVILQNYRWIRPKVTLGTSPSIDVIICAKKG